MRTNITPKKQGRFPESRRLIGVNSPHCSEAEYIALKMLAAEPREKRVAQPVSIRRFSWEKDEK